MADRMISLTIDEQEVSVPAGCTVYEAATAIGIHIPTFCHHPKLEPVGACRMCLVEIEGIPALQTSCTTPAREGMVVHVHTSPAAVKARKANIEFLLTNHPLDCPVCDKGGECPLQDQAMLDGPGASRYVEEKRHKNKRYPLGELIVLDQERCVLCWRCIRFLDEWADDHELDLFGRGANTRLDTFPGRPLASKWQGNTIDICPVGALTSRVFRFEARVWELDVTPSVCPLCAVGCNVDLGVKNNVLRRITPRENMQVNDAWICDKGRFGHGFVDHPDRLKTPLIRRNGQLKPATWDEALDLMARRFRGIIETHGPQAIGGLGSTRTTNETNYLFQRFMRTVVGTNNVDIQPSVAGRRMPTGVTPLSSLPALEQADAILLLGCDPSTEAPLVELWIKKAALRNGAAILAANPRRIELVRPVGVRLGAYGSSVPPAPARGGLWLGYRPGSQAALLLGLARAIIDAGPGSQAGRVTNLDEFQDWLRGYEPRRVEQLTGVPAADLLRAAGILARARRPIILYGPDSFLDSPVDALIDAIGNLSLLLGGEAGFMAQNNNALGALDMGVVPHLLPGGQSLLDRKVRGRLASFWRGALSPLEGLDFDGMMAAGRRGDLQAMWVMGSDPAYDCRIAGNALGRVPFLVVQDLFLTETASLAEVVLPAASFAETDGSFVNLTGRMQAIHAAMRPPGQARPDWQIIVQLARRMADDKHWAFSTPADVLDEISRVIPGYRGLDYDRMGDQGWQRPTQAPTRRNFVRVAPEGTSADPEYPLTLLTGRLFYDRGTLLRRSEPIQRLVPEAYVLVHPADAAKLDLTDGEEVSVVSAKGRLTFSVRISDEIVPGVVFAPLNLSDAPLSVLFADIRTLPRVHIAMQGRRG